MSAFRFLHAADLHLSSPSSGRLAMPEAMLRTVRDSTLAALERIVELAVNEQADLVLFSGDIYDAADRSVRAQFRFARALGELAERGIPSCVIHGNHDPESGYRAALDLPDSVHIFGSDEVRSTVIPDKRGQAFAEVHGISYRHAAVTENLAAQYRAGQAGLYQIAMLHGNVDGVQGHDNYAPCSLKELVQSGFDYWALGHIHKRAILHEQPWVVYPGNIQGRSVKETGARGIMLVDVQANKETSLRFEPTDQVRWIRAAVSIDGLEREQELHAALRRELASCLHQAEGRSAIVRIALEGRGPLHGALRRGDRLQEWLGELREEVLSEWEGGSAPFVWPESLRLHTGDSLDRDKLLKEDSFPGDLARMAQELCGNGDLLEAFDARASAGLGSSSRLNRLLATIDSEQKKEWLRQAEERALQLLMEGAGSRED